MAELKPTRAHLWRGLALGWLGLVSAAALAAPYLPLPFAPAAPDLAHMSVSPAAGAAFGHWLGTDPLGRDVLANLIFGSRTVLLLTLPAALLTALLGGVLGGLTGGWGSRASSRLLDGLVLAAGAMLGTVPRLLLVVAVAAGGRLSTAGLLALLVLTSWPGPARLVRAEALRVRALPFVEAARVLGLPAGRVWWRHVMPLAVRPLLVDLPLSLAGLISLESTLSFLGVGLAPDEASWGRLISAARLDLSAWWAAALPMAVLSFTILALRAVAARPWVSAGGPE